VGKADILQPVDQWAMDKADILQPVDQWTMDNGQLTMDNGQLTVDNGQWTVDNLREEDTSTLPSPNHLNGLLVFRHDARKNRRQLISFS